MEFIHTYHGRVSILIFLEHLYLSIKFIEALNWPPINKQFLFF